MMDAEFWLQRWREGRTGWHRSQVMPLLAKHWEAVGAPPHSRVLVPLCGKSLDMLWLSEQGHDVLGVELSPLAIEQFLDEHGLQVRQSEGAAGTHFRVLDPPGSGGIEIINGDIFAVDAATLAGCNAFYDRAATIALPAEGRARLAGEVYARLPPGALGLLIVLEYPPGEMEGPPFPVDRDEVERMFPTPWAAELLECRDIFADNPGFAEKGVTSLHTSVFALRKDHAA